MLIELTIYKCKKTKKARPVAICFTYKKNCQFTCALSQVQKCRITEQKHGYLPQSFLYLGLVSLSIWFGQFLTLKFSFHTDMSELLYHVMLHWRSEFLECMCVIYRNMMHSSHVRHFTDTGMRGNGIVLYLEKLSSCADRFIWSKNYFFLSYKITTKFINILIKRAFNEFAFLFFFYILE